MKQTFKTYRAVAAMLAAHGSLRAEGAAVDWKPAARWRLTAMALPRWLPRRSATIPILPW